MDSFNPAGELQIANKRKGQCLKGQVLEKCLDNLMRSDWIGHINCQTVCTAMIYTASLEYDKDLNWRDFAGLVIVSLIEELKGHTNPICKLQPTGDDRFPLMNKAARCLRDPKHVQERLRIKGIMESCNKHRKVIKYHQKKKAMLKKKLESVEDPDKEEKLKHCIESISKDIDGRTQEERGQYKAGCERVKKLNEFAFKRSRDQDLRLQDVKSKVGNTVFLAFHRKRLRSSSDDVV